MFNDTITLFNFKDGVYYPHIIRNVDAVGIIDGANATTLNGTSSNDTGTILIQTNSSRIFEVDDTMLPYVSPKAFGALEDGSQAITFQPQKDFIMLGEYGSAEPIIDDDYEAGFYDELNSTCDGVHQIVSAVFYYLIPHVEIGVK